MNFIPINPNIIKHMIIFYYNLDNTINYLIIFFSLLFEVNIKKNPQYWYKYY